MRSADLIALCEALSKAVDLGLGAAFSAELDPEGCAELAAALTEIDGLRSAAQHFEPVIAMQRKQIKELRAAVGVAAACGVKEAGAELARLRGEVKRLEADNDALRGSGAAYRAAIADWSAERDRLERLTAQRGVADCPRAGLDCGCWQCCGL